MNTRNQKFSKRLAILTVWALVFGMFVPAMPALAVGQLDLVKDTLSTSRPSIATTLSASASAGATELSVSDTTGILAGDAITLKNGATSESVTVSEVQTGQLGINSGLANSYPSGSDLFYKSTAVHNFQIKTNAAVNGGSIVITLPVGASANDGLPDQSGFDFNGLAASDISVSGFTAGSATINAASGTVSIPVSGNIAANSTLSVTVGNAGKLLNPYKNTTPGTAEIWTVLVQHKNSNDVVISTSSINIATIQAVKVSARVAPSLKFTINPVAGSASVGSITTSGATTATEVPFGTVTPGTGYSLAQYLRVETNSDSGYAVTAQQDGSLRKSNGTTIADLAGSATESSTSNGFGYGLKKKVNDPTVPFEYNDSGATFKAKRFETSPEQIMSETDSTTGSEVYVVYRLQVSASQPAGDYQTAVTYIATATY